MRFSDPFLRYSVLASIMRIWHPGQRGRSSRLTGKRNGPVIVRPSYLVGRVILKFFFRVVCAGATRAEARSLPGGGHASSSALRRTISVSGSYS